MKKQLSTAMAAAMAFGTVVPAFTNEVSAASTANTVDLSKAYKFLDANGNAVSATDVAKNGAPVLTRAQVYNYNGANADDRAAHTLKPQFDLEGIQILYAKQNTQDASQDLFVMVKVDERELVKVQRAKENLDFIIDDLKNYQNHDIQKFTADDFKITATKDATTGKITGYKFANEKLQDLYQANTSNGITTGAKNNLGTTSDPIYVSQQAEKDAKTALAQEFVDRGVEYNKVTNLLEATNSIQPRTAQTGTSNSTNKTVQEQITALTSEVTALTSDSTALSRINSTLSTVTITNTAVTSGVTTTTDITAAVSNNTTANNTLTTAKTALLEKIKTTPSNITVSIKEQTTTFGTAFTTSAVANYEINLDGTIVNIVRPGTTTANTTTLATTITNTKGIITEIQQAVQTRLSEVNKLITDTNAKIEALKQLENTASAELEKEVNAVLDVINSVINEVLNNGVLKASNDTDTARNGASYAAEQFKSTLLGLEIGRLTPANSNTERVYKFFTTDDNGNIVINKDDIIDYNKQNPTAQSDISMTDVIAKLSSELKTFMNDNTATTLKDLAKRDTLYSALVSYGNKADQSTMTYKAGRTIYVDFTDNCTTYEYKNEFQIKEATTTEALRKQITEGLTGLNNSHVTLGDSAITVNFNTENTDVKTDRQVYEAANKVKYALENLKDKVAVVKTEYGTNNKNTRVDVYVKNSDGTYDSTKKVITVNFENTIEARVNVAGKPSIVTMPAIKDTDFASLEWAQEEIVNAMLAGYVDATATFRPKDSITRAEFAKIVCTVFGIDTKDESVKNLVNPFADVKEANWYYNYVVALYNEGSKGTIIEGRENGNFDPNGNITRQEAAKMVAAAYDLKIEPLNTVGENAVSANRDGVVEKVVGVNSQKIHVDTVTKFSDDKDIQAWADESVTALVKENVIKGYEDGSFKPNEEIKRVDALYMLVKANKTVNADDSDIQQ